MKLFVFTPNDYDYTYYVMSTSLEEAIDVVLVEANKDRYVECLYEQHISPLNKGLTKDHLLDETKYTISVKEKNEVVFQEIA